MDVIWTRGRATVSDVLAGLADPPSYSAVRTLLAILERKGHLKHRQEGAAYVYLPARPRQAAAKGALQRLLKTFFDDSPEKAVAALLDVADAKLSRAELDRLADLIEAARQKGRGR